ncbi:MAG: AcvB/VirJ family lysyl-phosphatidylglycerol hydrolase [Gammaproteobacteria bacterium]
MRIVTIIALAAAASLLSVNLFEAERRVMSDASSAHIELPAQAAKGVAMLIQDDAGVGAPWQAELRAQAYAVVALDSHRFRACLATDACAALLRHTAARAGIALRAPLLVALGDAAELVPTALGAGLTPHAVLTVDYCPPARPGPAATPWYAFLSHAQSCGPLTDTEADTGLRLTRTAPAGRRAPAEFGALLQWLDPSLPTQGRASASVPGIPLIPTPVAHARRAVLLMSGDGGWAAFDRGLARALVDEGLAVIGWDALAYFWQPRTPAGMALDLARVMDEFHARWHLERVVLAGFSFGANTLPFAVNRLPPATRDLVEKVVLLSPTRETAFEFHLGQWLGEDGGDTRPVAPEIGRLAPLPSWCLRGADDDEARCPDLSAPGHSLTLPGDHHFDGDYVTLARLIARAPR